jgi:hypothetical protein
MARPGLSIEVASDQPDHSRAGRSLSVIQTFAQLHPDALTNNPARGREVGRMQKMQSSTVDIEP